MTTTLEPPAPADGRPLPAGPMTFDEYHDWLDEDTRAEWVDGEVIMPSPISDEHELKLDFLLRILMAFVHPRRLGRLSYSGMLMRLETRPSGRIPDLMFIAAEHLDRIKPTFLDGPADLVVEIVSPGSDARDHGEKFVEYESAGVPEYWLIDPLRRDASFFELNSEGRYQRASLGSEGFYSSKILAGFRLRPTWLWQQPLPDIEEIVSEIVSPTRAF